MSDTDTDVGHHGLTMTDRLVRPLDARGQPQGEARPFSTYLSQPNLILLGDPGAGKSHLFRSYGAGATLTARHFCLAPIARLRALETLFIDALDEKRSGRNDSASIDEIVRRLFEVQPKAVRISCRAADWLGSSDLSTLNVYFSTTGGVTVLVLEPLSNEVIADVLLTAGFSEPAAFVDQAEQRGMRELLGNPQNLMMLAEVVKGYGWPSTRRELFSRAVDVLLTEHDKEHGRKVGFTASELLLPAGAACAARLLADVDGISLLESNADASFPSYRHIGMFPAEQMLAALRRRAFVSTGLSESVDYAHRTIAEYLAANFLAHRIRKGELPFGRVHRMLCVDGRPASELRGLHAWLAVLLPDHASKLIASDAFGILAYGDSSALSTSHRREMLSALARLSGEDPWFRGAHWSIAALAPLGAEDMTDAIRPILTNPDDSRTLLVLVLDALRTGTPSKSLVPEFVALVKAPNEMHGVRWRAFEGLMSMGALAQTECVSAYRHMSVTHRELAIRASMLKSMLAANLLDASDVAQFVNDAFHASDSDHHISLFGLDRVISKGTEGDILDNVRFDLLPKHGMDSFVTRQAFQLIDQLLVRCVQTADEGNVAELVRRLTRRAAAARHRSISDTTLHDALKGSAQLRALIVATIDQIEEPEGWLCFVRLNEVLANSADTRNVLECMLQQIRLEDFDQRDYALALNCVMYEGADHQDVFEELYAVAEKRSELTKTRSEYCHTPVPDWRWEQAQHRNQRNAEELAQQQKTHRDFDAHRLDIVSGRHLGWLGHLAEVYFGRFSDLDRNAPPFDRLQGYLGESRALDTIEGLHELARSGRSSNVNEIVSMHSNQRYYSWWYAVLAGLDEFVARGGDLTTIPTESLDTAFVVNILHPTFKVSGNVEEVQQHSWFKWFVTRHPKRACDLLMQIVRADLASGQSYVHGLHELAEGIGELRPFRESYVTKLLEDFPEMSVQYLRQLLRVLLATNVLSTAMIASALRTSTYGEHHKLWLAAALIRDFHHFRSEADVILETTAQRNLVLSCMTLLGSRDAGSQSVPQLSASFSEYLLRRCFQCFRRIDFDDVDDERADWDTTQFTYALLNRLAASVDDSSRSVLERCLQNPAAQAYRDHIKHCLMQQEIRRVDSAYRQPTWPEALRVLANGKPVSVADLHALVVAHLEDIRDDIRFNNIDLFQGFWNQDGRTGKVASPKHENAGRNVLIGLLRNRLQHLDINVEPEVHMANENRADVGIYYPKMKIVIELKRHYHEELWTAATEQLERFYVKHQEAQGFGILGVFWYGLTLAPPPRSHKLVPFPPANASELETALISILPPSLRSKLSCLVFDVSDAAVEAKRGTSKNRRRRPSKN
jgi:hypothetical protein